MNIGFIGLGHLGTPIAENLLMQHQPLYVYNRTAAKAQPLADKGAVICTTVKELAALCDVVFSIVSDDAALNHITLGPDGIAAQLKTGGCNGGGGERGVRFILTPAQTVAAYPLPGL